ncbi:MAG: prepilin-type N-terminal cleavage/methylation domain-containing protein [Sedimentisphaerales bacterium]|nr:prepilin-type N-terminal cleavage/methylation domain-containing protein [Sedimentisphaerales bacterium]
MRSAFSIAELMIVAAIIGILAALSIPYLHNNAADAKEAAARDNLRVLREAIKFHAVHHNDTAPGYPGNDRSVQPTEDNFRLQLIIEQNYLRKVPSNPFNGLETLRIIGNAEGFPTEATGGYGWIYQPATGTIRLDWPGADNGGMRYLDY